MDPPRYYKGVKRAVDVVLASTMLLFGSPLLAMIAAAIKLEDKGPVFYRQSRWGLRGRSFDVLKFRTMRTGVGLEQAKENDERITRVGRWLRGFGLDEVPQLVNILKGEMSFVGPRPLAIGEVVVDGAGARVKYEDIFGFERRMSVVPGLTSLATIYLPKDISPMRKFRYDLLYVRRRSASLDMYLILISFWISFAAKWETRAPSKLRLERTSTNMTVSQLEFRRRAGSSRNVGL